MKTTWTDLAAGYMFVSIIVFGLPLIFFVITFLPGLMRTTGEQIGAEGHQHEAKKEPPRPLRSVRSKHGSAGRWRNLERIRNFENTP